MIKQTFSETKTLHCIEKIMQTTFLQNKMFAKQDDAWGRMRAFSAQNLV
jgi:hypothetical protein